MDGMDDEAFARMLQQQLLDEERMLMEQQEHEQQLAQQQQQQPPRQQYPPAGGYSDYGHGAPYGHQALPPQQSPYGHHQAPPPQQQQPYGHHQAPPPQQSPYGHHQAPPPQQQQPYGHHQAPPPQPVAFDAHAYAMSLQRQGIKKSQEAGPPPHQAPRSPPQQQPQYAPTPAPYQAEEEDADLALARHMSEMEAMQMAQGYEEPSHHAQSTPAYGQPPPLYNAAPANAEFSQEEEDARLARMLAESGASFRDLDLHGAGGQATEPPLRPMSSVQEPRSSGTQPPSFSGMKSPPSYTEPPPSVRETSQSSTGSGYGGEPATVPPPHSRNRSQELAQPPQKFAPKAPPQYGVRTDAPSRKPPPNMRPSPTGGPPARGPPPPAMARKNPPGMDPIPFDQGPLNPGSAGTPRQQPGKGRGAPKSPGTRPSSMMNEPPMMPGDAFLDVPAPVKKEKPKKKGLLKMFGRKEPDSSASAKPAAAAAAPSRGRFGGKAKGKSTGESYDQNPPEDAKPSASAKTPFDNGVEEDLVRFKIPEPVARPADTIGAPKGPLPYSLTVSRDAPLLPEATVGRQRQLSLSRNSAICAVCDLMAQNPLSALGKKFHNDCFRCITCHQLIDPAGAFAFLDTDGDKQPMHRKCYAEIFGIKCCVCEGSIPAGPDGKVSFVKHPFFDSEQMCPRHARNMTRRCTGCHRFEPENEPFAELNDVGRCVCMACCRSVVVDSHDAQPLWAKVVDFFDNKLNMPIWKDFKEVPILVVGYNALNDQMNNAQNVHSGASQIMTRGLCLTEHESGRRFRMQKMKFDKNAMTFVANDVEDRGFTFFQVPDASKSNPDASVTAILCLSGLPGDLTASVLAHEATHAWIKLHPRFDFERPIPPQVEEGCAQLIALLFLNEGLDPPNELEYNDGAGPSDEKLRQYFKFSIETDDHEIYGTGYRRAALAYSKIGIEALMSHIVLYQDFPEV
jgi:hypothetical protein